MTEGRGRSKKRTRAAAAELVQRADAVRVESAAGIEAAAMETIGAGPLGDRAPATAVDGLSDEQIRARAYQLYLERGGATGRELDDWLAAERSLRGREPDGPSAA